MIFYLDTPHPFLQWYYYISRLFVLERIPTHSHLYFFKHVVYRDDRLFYFFVICSMSFTNWLDYITCLFVLYRISTNSHLCTTNYSIFPQFLIVSPDKSTSARSSRIVIFDLWSSIMNTLMQLNILVVAECAHIRNNFWYW